MLKKVFIITFSLAMLGGFGACKKGGGGGGGGPMEGGGGGGGGPKAAGGGPGGGCKGGKCGGGQDQGSVLNEAGAGDNGLQPFTLPDGREVLVDGNGNVVDARTRQPLDPNSDPLVASLLQQLFPDQFGPNAVLGGAGPGGGSAGGENGFAPAPGSETRPDLFTPKPENTEAGPAFGDGSQEPGEAQDPVTDPEADKAALDAKVAGGLALTQAEQQRFDAYLAARDTTSENSDAGSQTH